VFATLDNRKIIEIDAWQKIGDLPYFRGWEIFFTSKLNDKRYIWHRNGYLATETWEKIADVTLDNVAEYLENLKTEDTSLIPNNIQNT
jgi:hypothetical protein